MCFFVCRGLVLLNAAGAMNRKGLMQDDLLLRAPPPCFIAMRAPFLQRPPKSPPSSLKSSVPRPTSRQGACTTRCGLLPLFLCFLFPLGLCLLSLPRAVFCFSPEDCVCCPPLMSCAAHSPARGSLALSTFNFFFIFFFFPP